jgi:hypothetical protein
MKTLSLQHYKFYQMRGVGKGGIYREMDGFYSLS